MVDENKFYGKVSMEIPVSKMKQERLSWVPDDLTYGCVNSYRIKVSNSLDGVKDGKILLYDSETGIVVVKFERDKDGDVSCFSYHTKPSHLKDAGVMWTLLLVWSINSPIELI